MDRQPPRFNVPRRVYLTQRRKCAYCPASIVWGVTDKGARVPLDVDQAEPIGEGQLALVSHWATCAGAERAAADRDAKRGKVPRPRKPKPTPPSGLPFA